MRSISPDGNPVDLGDLGNGHARISPGCGCAQILIEGSRASAARERPAPRPPRDGPGPAMRFPARAAYAPVDRPMAGSPTPMARQLANLPSRGEQRLGRLTRSRDPLAIIAAIVRLWLSA